MNIASHTSLDAPARNDSERQARIVEAAQRAFVRFGFHAATMQHVAEAAGMSAGNLYRYFPSKEALVEGLCRHDFDERAAIFHALASRVDIVDALVLILTEHVVGAAREKARLIVEIWAEAGRNPRISEITREFDVATHQGVRMLLAEAKSNRALPPAMDPDFVATTMVTLVSGLFKRLAIEPDFDRPREARHATAILRALLSGAIAPTAGSPSETI